MGFRLSTTMARQRENLRRDDPLYGPAFSSSTSSAWIALGVLSAMNNSDINFY